MGNSNDGRKIQISEDAFCFRDRKTVRDKEIRARARPKKSRDLIRSARERTIESNGAATFLRLSAFCRNESSSRERSDAIAIDRPRRFPLALSSSLPHPADEGLAARLSVPVVRASRRRRRACGRCVDRARSAHARAHRAWRSYYICMLSTRLIIGVYTRCVASGRKENQVRCVRLLGFATILRERARRERIFPNDRTLKSNNKLPDRCAIIFVFDFIARNAIVCNLIFQHQAGDLQESKSRKRGRFLCRCVAIIHAYASLSYR